MSRTGLLIGLAVLLIAGASGVLVWTNFLGQQNVSSLTVGQPTAQVSVGVDTRAEQKLVAQIMDVAFRGGFAATFSDKDTPKWKIAQGHKVEKFALGQKGPVMGRLSSSVARDKPFVLWSELGLSVELPTAFANASNGKGIEIGIVARQAQSNPSTTATAIYATRQSGNSEWRALNLTSEFQLIRFPYRVPLLEEGYKTGPMIVINADIAGGGSAVELLGVYVRIIPNT